MRTAIQEAITVDNGRRYITD